MHDEELKILLHDYFDDLLTEEEESDFQSQLMENRTLAIDLGKLKDLKRRLNNLPLNFEPPPKIISNITEKLLTLENVKEKTEAKKKSSKEKTVRVKKKRKKINRKLLLNLFIIVIILALGGGGGYYYYNINMSTSPWRVGLISGDFKIGNSTSLKQISEHQTFELAEDSESEIYVQDQGVILVKGKSKLEVLGAGKNINSISFIHGILEYIPKPMNSKFQIVKSDLIITSENSKFKIFSDDLGDFHLEILSNYLQIEFKKELFRFAHDYVVKIEADNVIRTPYSNKTTPDFIKLLSDYDYNHDSNTLIKIINLAAKNDALTLHFLLSQVAPAKRELIIDKLHSIIPLPYGVSKSDILILNQQMMNKWWDEIYSTIY